MVGVRRGVSLNLEAFRIKYTGLQDTETKYFRDLLLDLYHNKEVINFLISHVFQVCKIHFAWSAQRVLSGSQTFYTVAPTCTRG